VALAADNFSGTWKVNVEKSTYSPGPPPRSLTSRIEVVGDTMNFMFDGYDGFGKPILYEELSIKVDGQDHPVQDDPNRDTTSMRKIDDWTLEQTNKKDGKVTTVTRTVYSRDGKSRTATVTGTDAQGQKVHNVIFADRLR
jgi:hypothetical protein